MTSAAVSERVTLKKVLPVCVWITVN